MEEMREELRKALAELGPRGRGKAYPAGLLERLLSYTVARRRQGAALEEVGAELGMNYKTLSRWLGARSGAGRFERVEMVPAALPKAAPAASVVVHGPQGLRIEGSDVDGVAALVRRLGE